MVLLSKPRFVSGVFELNMNVHEDKNNMEHSFILAETHLNTIE